MNIEKALRNYLNNKGAKINYERFATIVKSNGNNAANVIFKLVNEEVDAIDDNKSLDRCVEVLKYLGVILTNCDNLNRKIIERKLGKLDEKLDRIELEDKNIYNIKHLKSEFNKIRRQLYKLEELVDTKDTKKYDLMQYLINELKQVEYIEYSVKFMPSLLNVKDKDERSLFRNLIKKYTENVENYNEENLAYYLNLISFIINQDKFILSNQEKKNCLNDINKCIDKLSYSKKKAKKNKEGLVWLEKLLNLLMKLNNKNRDIYDVASKYNIQVYFSDNIIEEARLVHIPKEGKMLDRKVLNDYIITIDKSSSIEIDDGLSCRMLPNGNYLLGVHIASVLGYFSYESDIVKEALKRDKTIYLSAIYQVKENDFSRIIPIFPYSFAAQDASLIEGMPKLARTYYFELDKSGNVVKEDFIKSIIHSNKRMTYDEVDDILKNGTDNSDLLETITNLKEITDILDKKSKGSDLYNSIKENTIDTTGLRVRKNGSENIVYQCMLLTGTKVAEFFYNNNYPCLYRVYETNEENDKKLEALINELSSTYGGKIYKNLFQLIQGIYPTGWYATSGSNYGLGVEHYCHCTSELRRSADIVVEHALEICHDNIPNSNDLKELKKEIEMRAHEINSKEKNIEWFVKDYQKVFHR